MAGYRVELFLLNRGLHSWAVLTGVSLSSWPTFSQSYATVWGSFNKNFSLSIIYFRGWAHREVWRLSLPINSVFSLYLSQTFPQRNCLSHLILSQCVLPGGLRLIAIPSKRLSRFRLLCLPDLLILVTAGRLALSFIQSCSRPSLLFSYCEQIISFYNSFPYKSFQCVLWIPKPSSPNTPASPSHFTVSPSSF